MATRRVLEDTREVVRIESDIIVFSFFGVLYQRLGGGSDKTRGRTRISAK